MNTINKPGLLLFTFIFYGFMLVSHLHGQELIAVHPLHSTAEAEEMGLIFHDLQLRYIPRVEDGLYRVYPIDLTRLPSDVPPGGFPPWICPSPSITGGAPYAITGSAEPDTEFPGEYRIRVFLWRMEDARLLGSDEMLTSSRQDCETKMPFFLDWVFSWIRHDSAEPQIIETFVYPDDYLIPPEPLPNYWLFLGLRAGMGSSLWAYDYGLNYAGSTRIITSLITANLALQADFHLTRIFSIQAEAIFTADFGNVDDLYTGEDEGFFNSMSFMFPLLAKFTFRGEQWSTGLFAGVYYFLPFMQTGSDKALEHFDYEPHFPGIVFGLQVSRRMGRGNLFLDGRVEYDGLWHDKSISNVIYYRYVFRLNIGYELGFFEKSR